MTAKWNAFLFHCMPMIGRYALSEIPVRTGQRIITVSLENMKIVLNLQELEI